MLTLLGGVVTLAVELLFYISLHKNAMLISTGLRYMQRYVLVPFVLFAADAGVCAAVCRLARSEKVKNYAVSYAMLILTFLISVVHTRFDAVFMLNALPILCSTLYMDRRLTTVISASSVVLLWLSAFVIRYDSTGAQHGAEFKYNVCIFIIIDIGIYAACLFAIRWQRDRMRAVITQSQRLRRMESLALMDELTGIRNRHAFRDYLDCLPQGADLWLAMFDLDHFKRINDAYGHPVGDEVLHGVGAVLQRCTGASAVSFRYGDDEFCVFFAAPSCAEASRYCEDLRAAVSSKPLAGAKGPAVTTVSIGVARVEPGAVPDELVQHADKAMYAAKRTGNSVAVYTSGMDKG
jgi:diguanylate cyclase (GGDEF)-like protein